jgi:predicted esterase YcpF (UPF0227 family)
MVGEILYIHGFASSSNSYKASLLDEYFKQLGLNIVLRPSLPVAPLKAIEFLKEIYEHNPLKVVVGSSFGGFYALYLHQWFDGHTVLINPSLQPSRTLADKTGLIKRHNSEDFFHWTDDHVKQLKKLEEELDFGKLKQQTLHFYLAKDDEILNHSKIPEIFSQAQIKFYEESKHVFMNFDKILPEIFNIYSLQNQ